MLSIQFNSLFFGPLSALVARRVNAPQYGNRTASSLWLTASRLLSDYFTTRNYCASTAIASLYFSLALRPSALSIPWCLDRLRGTLRSAIGVRPQRLHNCIQAWPCGQAFSIYFGPLATRVARRAAIFQLHISLWPNGQAHALYPSARSPPALRGGSACLNCISNREMLTAYDWPRHLPPPLGYGRASSQIMPPVGIEPTRFAQSSF